MADEKIMEVSQALAYAVKQCKPDVIPMYPITPQTHIVEKLADYVDNGELKSQIIHADSEFSAISAALGASASGSKVFTATASQGLALMHEVLHIISGMRLPVVMAVANRALSAPINIWNDHQDSMSARDTGWIQFYVESSQEAYDTIFMAYQLANQKNILLPVMVCLDGFSLSHVFEPVEMFNQQTINSFLGKYQPQHPVLDTKKPVTMGPVGFPDTFMSFKKAQQDAMEQALKEIKSISAGFKKMSGRNYGDGLIETYNLSGSESAILCMGSVCGTVRDAIDDLKKNNVNVGLIKMKTYRPFPESRLKQLSKNLKNIAVIDKDISIGATGAVAADVKAALRDVPQKNVQDYIMGLGGKDITKNDIYQIVQNFDKKITTPKWMV